MPFLKYFHARELLEDKNARACVSISVNVFTENH